MCAMINQRENELICEIYKSLLFSTQASFHIKYSRQKPHPHDSLHVYIYNRKWKMENDHDINQLISQILIKHQILIMEKKQLWQRNYSIN